MPLQIEFAACLRIYPPAAGGVTGPGYTEVPERAGFYLALGDPGSSCLEDPLVRPTILHALDTMSAADRIARPDRLRRQSRSLRDLKERRNMLRCRRFQGDADRLAFLLGAFQGSYC
jgi:hypothetical protein